MVLAASVTRVHESHRPRFSPSRIFTDARQLPRQSWICQLIHLECEKLPNTRLERNENLFKRQSPIGGASHDSFRIERRPVCPYRSDGSLIPMLLGGVGVGVTQCDQHADPRPINPDEFIPQFITQSSGPNPMCCEACNGVRTHTSRCGLASARRAYPSLRPISKNRLSHDRHSRVCTADE